jgi:hypothetical protein
MDNVSESLLHSQPGSEVEGEEPNQNQNPNQRSAAQKVPDSSESEDVVGHSEEHSQSASSANDGGFGASTGLASSGLPTDLRSLQTQHVGSGQTPPPQARILQGPDSLPRSDEDTNHAMSEQRRSRGTSQSRSNFNLSVTDFYNAGGARLYEEEEDGTLEAVADALNLDVESLQEKLEHSTARLQSLVESFSSEGTLSTSQRKTTGSTISNGSSRRRFSVGDTLDGRLAKRVEKDGASAVAIIVEPDQDRDRAAEELTPVTPAPPVPTPALSSINSTSTFHLRNGSIPSSAVVFRSKPSSRSQSTGPRSVSDLSGSDSRTTLASSATPGSPSRSEDRGRVRWHKNIVKDVVVYEVDREVYMDIQYKRNALGWVVLAIAVLLDVIYASHTAYLSIVDGISLYTLNLWACLWKLPMFFGMGLGVILANIVAPSEFKELFTRKGLIALVFSLAGSLSLIIPVAVGQYEASIPMHSTYFPTFNLDLVWMIGWRSIKKLPRFFQEYVGTFIAFVGFIIVCVGSYSTPTWEEGLIINAFLVGVSVTYALWFLVLENLVAQIRSTAVSYSLCTITDAVVAIIAAVCVYPTVHEQDRVKLWHVVDVETIPTAIALSVELLFTQMCYIAAARYLDVMSLAGAMALKLVLIPYAVRIVLLGTPQESAFPDPRWGPYLWGGTPVVILGCLILIVFASIKRQFVERRVAREILRNSTTKKVDRKNWRSPLYP